MKILVVEDDPFVRDMAVAELGLAGFEVVEAADGNYALKLLQTGIVIDVLLTDIRLPGANGWKETRLTATASRTSLLCIWSVMPRPRSPFLEVLLSRSLTSCLRSSTF
jgi:CheY-like chemotaxis protein